MAGRPTTSPAAGPPPELEARWRARSEADGFLPFDRFMEEALYTEGAGYYARDRSPLGAGGDFYTAAHVHPAYARTVAARALAVREALPTGEPFTVVDLGSGDGTLAAGVAAAFAAAAAPATFVVIDRSSRRRAEALAAVQRATADRTVRLRAEASIDAVGPFVGFVLAHELLDAQPVQRWRWDGDRWSELGFRSEGGRWVEAERQCSSGRGPPGTPACPPEEAGTVFEWAPGWSALLRGVADRLAGGLLVVVDYGDAGTALRAGHRHGTVAALRSHRTVPVAPETAGAADLSAFVDFSVVRDAARRAGLVEVAYRPQAEALAAWGFAEELAREAGERTTSVDRVRSHLAAKNLWFGFSNFRVLELAAPASAGRLGAISGAEDPRATR